MRVNIKMKFQTLSTSIATSLLLLSNPANAQTSESSIEKVTVVANRVAVDSKQLAASITVIDETDIQSSLGLNVTDILRNTPSVGVSNSGGLGKNTTLRIRGEEGYRTKLFIDGVELSDPSAPQVAPQFDDVLSGQVQRIEVLRGTQGLAYGADAGGIVSIYTKDAEKGLNLRGAASLSRYDTRSLSANISAAGETGSIYLGATDISSDGFNAQTADTSNEADGYDNTSVHLKAKLKLSNKISASFVIRDLDAQNEYDSCFDSSFAQVNDCYTDTQNTTARASVDYVDAVQSHSISVSHTDVERQFFSSQAFSFANKGSIDKLDYLGSRKTENQQFVFGVDGKREEIDGSDSKRTQRGIFGEWISRLTESLSINLGARYDDNDTFGSHLSYRLGFAHLTEIDNQGVVKFKGSYGTGFRAPSLFEQNYNDGPFAFGDAAGLQLNEEQSEGADIGVEYQSNYGLIAELVLFKQTIEDEIFFGTGFEGYLQNDGDSHSEGVEVSAEQTLNRQYSVWGNYTYNDSEDSNGDPRLRRPKHKANLGVRTSLLNDDLMLDAHIRIVRDAKGIGQVSLDNYTITNFSANYAVSTQLKLKAGITNLFDKEYEEVIGFNTAGRSVYVGLAVSLQ